MDVEHRCSSAFALPLSKGVCERGIAAAARCDLITIESLDKHPERPEIHLKFEPC